MIVNHEHLARDIRKKLPHLNQKDIVATILAMNDVIVEHLEDGDDVKLHKLLKLTNEVSKEHRAYNGLRKEYYIKPERPVIKISPLTKITNIHK